MACCASATRLRCVVRGQLPHLPAKGAGRSARSAFPARSCVWAHLVARNQLGQVCASCLLEVCVSSSSAGMQWNATAFCCMQGRRKASLKAELTWQTCGKNFRALCKGVPSSNVSGPEQWHGEQSWCFVAKSLLLGKLLWPEARMELHGTRWYCKSEKARMSIAALPLWSLGLLSTSDMNLESPG